MAPASITSAVLYYFGWLRSQTIAQDLGYDATILGYGPQDYILRSVQPVATLAVIGAIGWWVLLLVHRSAIGWIRRYGSGWGHWRRLALAMLVIGTLLIVHTIHTTLDGFDRADWRLALELVGAAAFLGYGTWLEQYPRRQPWLRVEVPQPVIWIVMALIAAGAFTVTSWYAQELGHQRAEENRQMAREAAVATLSSAKPLGLEGVPSYAEGDHYITTGLTLMFSAGGRHFLLPIDYDQRTKAKVYTVDAAAVRIDFDRSNSVPCAGFDDLEAGHRYEIGDVVVSGGVRYTITALPAGDAAGEGPPLPVDADQAPGATVQAADGFGQDLVVHLQRVMLAPEFDAPFRLWTVRYRQLAPSVRAEFNGSGATVEKVTLLPRDRYLRRIGGAAVRGNTDGLLQLQAGSGDPLYQMAIGGADLVLDCDAER